MVHRGATQQSSAPFNRRIVLDVIRRAGEISRKEIIDRVALSPQTIANITQDLETIGLVVSRRQRGARMRGQPPMAFALNPKGGDSIGISLEPRRASAALVNLVGEVLQRSEAAIDSHDVRGSLQVMVDLVRDLAARSLHARRIWGVGVAMPGPFGVPSMSFVGPTAFEGWHDLTPLDDLQTQTGLPVFYSVDSVAGALGESLFGVASAFRSFFYLHFGVGLGGTLVIDKAAYRGAAGNATEIGHVPVETDGKPCYCGNRGCLERYLSLHALSEHLRGEGGAELSNEEVQQLLAAGDERLNRWCDSAAVYLRAAVRLIENLLDPETIVIGGSAPAGLVSRLVERAQPLDSSVRADVGQVPRLVQAGGQDESALLGAAVLPIYEALSPRFDVLLQERRRRHAVDSLLGRSANSRPVRA